MLEPMLRVRAAIILAVRLMARLERMERLLRPQERVHVVEVPIALIHDEDAVAQLLAAKASIRTRAIL